MTKFTLAFVFFLPVILLTGCKKDDNDIGPQTTEELTTEELEFFDTQEAFEVDPEEILLPNGENIIDFLMETDPDFLTDFKSSPAEEAKGPQTVKNETLGKMLYMASYLTNDTYFRYEGNEMLTGIPSQDGLAYSFGSKNYSVRQRPPYGECTDDVYGLDCSGFVYHLFLAADIIIPEGTAESQRQVTTLNNAISGDPGFSKIKFEDFGQLPPGELEAGDIIYWKRRNNTAFHIGMVLKTTGGQLLIFQSNGTSKVSGNCENNYSKNRGPRTIGLSSYNMFDAASYGIVRMVTDISGSWTLYLRCVGQSADVLTIQITIPVNEGGSFTANGTGIDYNGAPITAVLDGQYNNQSNTLSGIFTFQFPDNPDDIRKDSFSVRLDKDETDYFAMVKVLDNSGCQLEIRLMNNEIALKKVSAGHHVVPGIYAGSSDRTE